MADKAIPAGANGGRRSGTENVSPVTSDNSTPAPEPTIRGIRETPYNAGMLALEYHVSARDSADLRRDLVAMESAARAFDGVLRNRRALTVQALQIRGEL